MLKKFASISAAIALLSGTTVQAAEPGQCMSPETAESLITYVLPVALDAARNKCASSLPATAALLQTDSAQMQRYVEASQKAWPEAGTAIGLLVGQDLPENMDVEALRPFIDAMIPAMLTKEIKEKDCPSIDKVYKLLEPLPTSNIASLTVMLVQLGNNDKEGSEKSAFNICKAGTE